MLQTKVRWLDCNDLRLNLSLRVFRKRLGNTRTTSSSDNHGWSVTERSQWDTEINADGLSVLTLQLIETSH